MQEMLEVNAGSDGAKLTLIPFRVDDDARERAASVLGGETITLLHAHVKRQLSDMGTTDDPQVSAMQMCGADGCCRLS